MGDYAAVKMSQWHKKKIDALKHNVEGIKQVTGGILKVNVGKMVILLKISEFMNGCLGGTSADCKFTFNCFPFCLLPSVFYLLLSSNIFLQKISYLGARDQP